MCVVCVGLTSTCLCMWWIFACVRVITHMSGPGLPYRTWVDEAVQMFQPRPGAAFIWTWGTDGYSCEPAWIKRPSAVVDAAALFNEHGHWPEGSGPVGFDDVLLDVYEGTGGKHNALHMHIFQDAHARACTRPRPLCLQASES